jgi:glutamate synthase (NADPH/NADH) small chain
VKGCDFRVEADIIIFALGFSPANPDFLAENGIEVNKWGCIEVNENYETSKSGVYAGGDCKRGSDLVVTAAADGKEAAQSIIKSLLT